MVGKSVVTFTVGWSETEIVGTFVGKLVCVNALGLGSAVVVGRFCDGLAVGERVVLWTCSVDGPMLGSTVVVETDGGSVAGTATSFPDGAAVFDIGEIVGEIDAGVSVDAGASVGAFITTEIGELDGFSVDEIRREGEVVGSFDGKAGLPVSFFEKVGTSEGEIDGLIVGDSDGDIVGSNASVTGDSVGL